MKKILMLLSLVSLTLTANLHVNNMTGGTITFSSNGNNKNLTLKSGQNSIALEDLGLTEDEIHSGKLTDGTPIKYRAEESAWLKTTFITTPHEWHLNVAETAPEQGQLSIYGGK